MNETNAVAVRPGHAISETLTVHDMLSHVSLIQETMRAVMKDGEHYGKIPGCGDKPSLLQPGAQKLLLAFRMNPDYDVTVVDMDRGHREYRIQCKLTSSSGQFVGSGVGSATTMESKWRFRTGPKEFTDKPVPKSYWDNRQTNPAAALESIGGKGFTIGKNDSGQWMIAVAGEKVEHDNPADYYNTCLKMAKKRALVDAVLTRTAASDIFTQDIEEIRENLDAATGTAAVAPQTPGAVPEPHPKMAPVVNVESEPVKPVADGTSKAEAKVVEVKKFEGVSQKNGKPWTRWGITLQDSSGATMIAGTFDTKLGEAATALQGQSVQVAFKPGRKEGTFDLTAIEGNDDVGF
jgi:hypothetical protein